MAKREPLLVHLYREVGMREAVRAASFIVAWGLYVDDPKSPKPPSLKGYEVYWKQSESTSYRECRAFRNAFPDDPFPDRQWAMIRRQVEARKGKVGSGAKAAMFVEGVWA